MRLTRCGSALGLLGLETAGLQGSGRRAAVFRQQYCRVQAAVSAAVPFAGCCAVVHVMITLQVLNKCMMLSQRLSQAWMDGDYAPAKQHIAVLLAVPLAVPVGGARC